MLDSLLTKQALTAAVEKLVRTESMSYMEAILHVCKERGIDPIDIGKLVAPTIRLKVEVEAQERNMLSHNKKTNSLKRFFK